MERIYYAGSSFLTGNAIAQALINYAKFLVAHRSTASVDIPIRHGDGTNGRASFLLGPTSELVSQTEYSASGEIEDDLLVARLQKRSAGITLSNQAGVDSAESTESTDESGRYFDLYDLREYV